MSDAAVPKSSWADDVDEEELNFKAEAPSSDNVPSETVEAGGQQTTDENKEDESSLTQNQYDVAVILADIQGDPNSPLYSIKRFEDLGL